MKKLIFKLGIILVLGAILCSCASRPSAGTSKPSAKEDTFTPSTLEGLDKKTASYESYKKAAQSAFASLVPTSADEFEYSECEGGVSIDRHIGDSELVVLPSEINGKTVVKIAAEAFYIEDNKDTEEIEASRVRSVYAPDSVVSIGKGAFKNCTSLLLIRLPFIGDGQTQTHVGYVFGADGYDKNAINIPNSLETVIIGDARCVADRAFYGAKSIDAILLCGVESIGKFAFYECDELVYIGLGDKLKTIGSYAFSSCLSLPKIELCESVESIGFGAFYMCRSMCDMTLPFIGDGGEHAYLGYIFGAGSSAWNSDFVSTSLVSVTLLEGCKRIENKAFAGCDGIVCVNLPETLEYIGIRSFYGCRSLAEIETKDALTTISTDAFFGCDNLKKLTVKGETEIAAQAFYGCDSLTEKNINQKAKVHENAF